MIGWSEDELAVRAMVRDFVDKEVRPLQDDLEHHGLPPYDVLRRLYAAFGIGEMAAEAFDRQVAALESGEPREPRDGGSGGSGGGWDLAMASIVNIELAKVAMGLSSALGVSMGLAAGTINARGTLEQRRRWARDLLTLDTVGAWAITEPDSGSDAFGGMRTTVRPDGDGWVLSGQKTFITNGPYADTIVVYAKLDDGSGVPRREQPVMTFVLDAGMPGLTQGKPFKKMGIASSPTGELFFDDVRLDRSRLLVGSGSDGRESARSNFVVERVGIATLALGVIEECLRLCLDYARTRELWGRPIGEFQLIQLKLAEMEVARLNVENMVFRAIESRRSGVTLSIAEASAMKLYSSRAACEVAMEAVQLFGGNGYMAEYRVEQLARDAKSLMIYAGSNEVQVTHVAKGLLRG
ncbi:acyl-CoA dehydrogenase family protein [Nocardioides sp.]|uniref:acyl-CoA dehydrogenase family protein n=1 Tax=Nocardioides sp. TaxID=35761 RepID=UPI0035147453